MDSSIVSDNQLLSDSFVGSENQPRRQESEI
jgi:hypothetical protein